MKQTVAGVTLVACTLLGLACQNKSGSDFMVGFGDAHIFEDSKVFEDARVYLDAPPDAFVYHDAHIYNDAHIYEDAHVYQDAHVYNDAPPPPPVRMCTNKTPDFTDDHTNEHLTLSVVCQSTADATNVNIRLQSGTDVIFLTVALQCLAGGVAANNFLVIPVTAMQNFHATHIAATGFDIDCI